MNKVRIFYDDMMYILENRINDFAREYEIISTSIAYKPVGLGNEYIAAVTYKDKE